jgi:hypothetical protein
MLQYTYLYIYCACIPILIVSVELCTYSVYYNNIRIYVWLLHYNHTILQYLISVYIPFNHI